MAAAGSIASPSVADRVGRCRGRCHVQEDDKVSPYLRRPIRTYEQFLREQAEQSRGAGRIESALEPSARNHHRRGIDGVQHCS